MRGFLTLEILMALMIATSTLIAVALVTLGTPEVLARSEEHREALGESRVALEKVVAQSMSDFNSVASVATTTQGRYETAVSIYTLPSGGEKRIVAQTLWKDEFDQFHDVTLSSIVTDFTHPPDTACTSALVGDWTTPTTHSTSFTGFGIKDITSVGATLVAVASTTSNKTDSTVFLFTPNTDGTLTKTTSIDNSSASVAGLNAITHSGTTLYLASAASCTSSTCGQLQVATISNIGTLSMVSRLLLATSSAPFAKVSGGAPAAAESIAYKNNTVYIGLDKTSGGDEFNLIDVSTPATPTWLGGYAVGATVTSITLRGTLAYLTTNDPTRDVLVLDIHDPTNISVVSSYDAPLKGIGGTANTLAFSGNDLWLARDYAASSDELSILDITNPAVPLPITSKDITSGLDSVSVYGLVLRDSLALLLTKKDIQLWGTANLTNPIFQKSIPLYNNSVGTALTCNLQTLYVSSIGGGTSYITTLTGS